MFCDRQNMTNVMCSRMLNMLPIRSATDCFNASPITIPSALHYKGNALGTSPLVACSHHISAMNEVLHPGIYFVQLV